MTISRRRILYAAGLGGLAGPLGLWGCADDETNPPNDEPEPSPAPPDDPNQPWWLRRNFAPVEESEATELTIEGAIPPSLAGLFVRNGPNPLHADSVHWFTGDGMVHGLTLEGGRASYRARYVQTDVLGLRADEVGPPGPTAHQANTSILMHRGKVLCLEEVGVPYELSPSDLSTVGPYDFDGALASAMTAHPKVAASGEVFFFGYGLLDDSFTYHRTDASGILVASEKIALPAAVMMHDFQVTETHVVFFDLPILFDLQLAIDGAVFPFKWQPKNGARIGVLPKYGTAADIRWIEIEPCYIFHTWNSFHDEADPTKIHLDAIRYETMWKDGPSDFTAAGTPVRYTLDLTNETASFTPFEERRMEFPRVSPKLQSREHRYAYAARMAASEPNGGAPPSDGIFKLDRVGGSVRALDLPAGHEGGEPLFVPDPDGSGEDDGWLLTYVFDNAVNRSHLLVVDASDMKTVAKVLLPVRVPHGFHAAFTPSGVNQ